jgi:hypothetical protein
MSTMDCHRRVLRRKQTSLAHDCFYIEPLLIESTVVGPLQ